MMMEQKPLFVCAEPSLASVLMRYPAGISSGKNTQDSGKCCILEAHSVCLGIQWTDNPWLNHIWDFRPINDMRVSMSLRTKWMLKVLPAYTGSLDWDVSMARRVSNAIATGTVRQLIAEIPGLSSDARNECRAARTLKQAQASARAAQAVVEPEAARVAAAAAEAAAWAAEAARGAATAEAAAWAAEAARGAAATAEAAAWAAEAAAHAAHGAARAAAEAADGDAQAAAEAAVAAVAAVFIKTCKLWLRAAAKRNLGQPELIGVTVT